MCKKILICSGDTNILKELTSILRDQYRLILTDTSEQCFSCLENDKYIDLIVTTLNPMSTSDFKNLNQIHEKYSHTPQILITNDSNNEMDIVTIITRPLKSKILHKEIRKAIKDKSYQLR